MIQLQIKDDILEFSMHDSPGARTMKKLAVIPLSSVRHILRHEPSTAAEVEVAIAEVEDLIIPVIRTLPPANSLETRGHAFDGIMKVLPFEKGGSVSLESVEQLFGRMAKVAMGSPARSEGIPVTASFSLGLIVLREVMHHGGFVSVASA